MDLKKDFNRLVPKCFEHNPNLTLVNTSWPKPQTTYETNTDCVGDFWPQVAKFVFVSNLLFSQVSTLQTDKQWQRWKSTTPVCIASARPIFWHFSTLLCVLIHTSGTTGLDMFTNRCIKLPRQIGPFLNLLQSRGNNRLWRRFRKYATVFTLCVDWVGQTYAGLRRWHE